MTVQRLFEGKDDYEKESNQLNNQKMGVETSKKAWQDAIAVVEGHREKMKRGFIRVDYKAVDAQKKYYEGLVKVEDANIEKINIQIASLDNKYNRRNSQYRRIKNEERYLNIAMVGFLVFAIILVLVPSFGSGLSFVLFSISILLLIWRVALHGQEVV